jgi:hypothetical protein
MAQDQQQQRGNHSHSKSPNSANPEADRDSLPAQNGKHQVNVTRFQSQLMANSFHQKKTEERRRQLNRRAQKAFRERRTEHMAQLEVSIEHMKKELHISQVARSSAIEELMMVKYKNSLLERLLLEKGASGLRDIG